MQCWHPGALPSPKVSLCSKLRPCCVMGQDVWASVFCHTHPPPGVRAQQRLWFTATHPPVWTSKGQGCQAQHRAHLPLGWMLFQSFGLGNSALAMPVTGLSSKQN